MSPMQRIFLSLLFVSLGFTSSSASDSEEDPAAESSPSDEEPEVSESEVKVGGAGGNGVDPTAGGGLFWLFGAAAVAASEAAETL